jgi:hypothetical protein
MELQDWIMGFKFVQELLQHVIRIDVWLGRVGRKMQVRVCVIDVITDSAAVPAAASWQPCSMSQALARAWHA